MELDYYLRVAHENEELKALLRQQHFDILHFNAITCECGVLRDMSIAYKCLYCGVCFCFDCGEKHFGTVKEYTLKKHRKHKASLMAEWEDQQKIVLEDEFNTLIDNNYG
jgi:hypothetical protein